MLMIQLSLKMYSVGFEKVIFILCMLLENAQDKNYHFKFLKCTVGWYQVHSQSCVVTEMHFQNFSWSTPKEMLHPLNNCFSSPHPPDSRCPLFLLNCVCQLQRSHVDGILPYLPTCDWEISRRMSSELIHAALYIRTTSLFKDDYYFTVFTLYFWGALNLSWTQSLVINCEPADSADGDVSSSDVVCAVNTVPGGHG